MISFGIPMDECNRAALIQHTAEQVQELGIVETPNSSIINKVAFEECILLMKGV